MSDLDGCSAKEHETPRQVGRVSPLRAGSGKDSPRDPHEGETLLWEPCVGRDELYESLTFQRFFEQLVCGFWFPRRGGWRRGQNPVGRPSKSNTFPTTRGGGFNNRGKNEPHPETK